MCVCDVWIDPLVARLPPRPSNLPAPSGQIVHICRRGDQRHADQKKEEGKKKGFKIKNKKGAHRHISHTCTHTHTHTHTHTRSRPSVLQHGSISAGVRQLSLPTPPLLLLTHHPGQLDLFFPQTERHPRSTSSKPRWMPVLLLQP